jgi:predicted secreted hydrolase
MPLALLLFFAFADYRLAVPGYHYQFPRDHFAHADFQTEWWYYTGNLRARDGHRYGFELVFFRQGKKDTPRDDPSAWRVDDLYLAHLALTDSEDDAEPTYWEGAVTYSGSATGVGYLEMTGYGKPPKLHEKL